MHYDTSMSNESGSGGKGIVLVVEDDPFLAGMLSSSLKEAGLDVEHAVDAETGLTILESKPVRLVLLDIILPGMDGYEFLKRAKANPKVASVPIFVLSNLGQKDEVDRAVAMGAQAFMVKAQLDLSEIVAHVRQLVENPDSAITPSS
jgi:DNA-binding response OmpR family regulator